MRKWREHSGARARLTPWVDDVEEAWRREIELVWLTCESISSIKACRTPNTLSAVRGTGRSTDLGPFIPSRSLEKVAYFTRSIGKVAYHSIDRESGMSHLLGCATGRGLTASSSLKLAAACRARQGQQRPATAAVSSEGSQLCRWATWSYPSVCRRLLGDRACRLIRRRTLALAARTRGLGHRNSNQGYVVGSGYRAVAVADAAVAIAVRWSQGALLVLA